jgi:hypothetical protein
VWARNGRELFFRDGDGFLNAVPVQADARFSPGRPAKVFETLPGGGAARNYDVSPDGQRFLILKDITDPSPAGNPAKIIVVLNWLEELKRLVPAK